MQKIRNIFFALMALFGLSLIVADWRRSHAYETEVLVPLRQALVLTTDKAAPLVSRAALFAEAHGMTDKENPTCPPYEVSCAESLVDIASDMASLDSALVRKPFLEVYPQASQVVKGMCLQVPSHHTWVWMVAGVAGIILLFFGLLHFLARLLGYSGLF